MGGHPIRYIMEASTAVALGALRDDGIDRKVSECNRWEGEQDRDRDFLSRVFDRNFQIMESAVGIMADICDILCEKNNAVRAAKTHPHQSSRATEVVRQCALNLEPELEEDMPEVLMEDSQKGTECDHTSHHSPSQSLLSVSRAHGKGTGPQTKPRHYLVWVPVHGNIGAVGKSVFATLHSHGCDGS